MLTLSGISAIFPAYNDGGTIASMVVKAFMVLPRIAADYEVIVVDDGSSDSTAEVLAELLKLYPQRLRVITHPQSLGYGAALRAGFAAATQKWIFYTDGNAHYDPADITNLLTVGHAEVDIINGYKSLQHAPFSRRALSWIYQQLIRLAFKLPLRDVDCDFRLFRRQLLERITLTATDGTIAPELIFKFWAAGCRFAEAPVSYCYREFGSGQLFNFRRLWRVGFELAHLWRQAQR